MKKFWKKSLLLLTVLGALGILFSCSHPGEETEDKVSIEQDSRYVMPISYRLLKEAMQKKKYKFFTGHLNINIIGIRYNSNKSNEWDDRLCVAYQENGVNKVLSFDEYTTDPGSYYLQHPLNSLGCAIVVPGQYRGVFKIGRHKNKYEALVQKSNISVYRDNNKDTILNFSGKKYSGMYGINLHHGGGSSKIGKYSAGCQVIRKAADLKKLLDLCKRSAKRYGSTFTYTVLNKSDVY